MEMAGGVYDDSAVSESDVDVGEYWMASSMGDCDGCSADGSSEGGGAYSI